MAKRSAPANPAAKSRAPKNVSGSGLSFEFPIAEWSKLLDRYGDTNRLLMVNPTVAIVLEHFVRTPLTRIAPLAILQSAFNRPFDDLKKPGGFAILSDQPVKARDLYPVPKDGLVWDLGCGEGALGRWLDELGLKYLGVDANRDYIAHANKNKSATQRTTFIHSTIETFLKRTAFNAEKPSLITLFGVLLDSELDSKIVESISQFLKSRGWHDVPLLITTFDPDYFSPTHPAHKKQIAGLRLSAEVKQIPIVDPAVWELIFAEHDLFVLEQRPYQLHRTPLEVQKQIIKRREFEVIECSSELYSSPPRHGPFYFWLLSAKKGSASGTHYGLPCQLGVYASNEVIELTANIPARVYEVSSGRVALERRSRDFMTFRPNAIFGQLEMGKNYFASRQIGTLTAREDTALKSISTTSIKQTEEWASGLPARLLTSLLGHYESLAFDELMSSTPKKKARDLSNPLGRGQRENVMNCAAALLHLCSQAIQADSSQFTSRILLEVSLEKLDRIIVGEDPRNGDQKIPSYREKLIISALADFNSAGIIDSYSTCGVSGYQFQELIWHRPDALRHGEPNIDRVDFQPNYDIYSVEHFGVWVLQFLHCSLPLNYLEFMEIEPVLREPRRKLSTDQLIEVGLSAASITAALGFEHDRDGLVANGAVETPEKFVRFDEDREKKNPYPATIFNSYFEELFYPEYGEHGEHGDIIKKLKHFFTILDAKFGYSSAPRMELDGLSSYIYVRDVWALFACALDDDRIWKSANREKGPEDHRKNVERYRREAYFKHCIRHIGRLSGLHLATAEANSPGTGSFDKALIM